MMTAEHLRLDENAKKEVPLEKWGPYLTERQWGTVREDYSEGGDAWNYFPHDHARSRVYRWGEDGLAGISDYMQNLCFAVALWNGKDPILKERLFGLTNEEGNHGEDVKELYYYLDNLPTHYYMKYLYKYPQNEYPYLDLIEKNKERTRQETEYEILDTGIFNTNNYFDVFVEYAKNNSEDVFIKIEIVNRSADAAPITVLPTLWFYNRWQYDPSLQKPSIHYVNNATVKATHQHLGEYYLYFKDAAELLFTDNETNTERLFDNPNSSPFVKDAFHDAVIKGSNKEALIERKQGTKCSPVYHLNIEGNSSQKIFLRLCSDVIDQPFPDNFENVFDLRKKEADEFYKAVLPPNVTADLATIQRQAFAGLLWSKQYYHYDIARWLNTNDGIAPTSSQRSAGRNASWKYLKNQDIILMPDKWEYPWYASWDSAFHCIAMAIIDPIFSKNQLVLLMREWYMDPSGQIPAYEWNFSDVNPPVHAFAALQVYRIEKETKGSSDVAFLKKVFQKLIINFTWWINRKDANGNNVFEGGFLGLDNIGVFNRNIQLPGETLLEQSDGTSWMGMYALNMMDIALEIADADDAFEDAATKFYEHFVIIAESLNVMGLWNNEDHFFYDVLCLRGQEPFSLKVRSVVGLIPLLAVSIVKEDVLNKLSDFKKRMQWLSNYRKENNEFLPNQQKSDSNDMLLSLIHEDRLKYILERLLDETEFLSPGGIRALSKYHEQHPYFIDVDSTTYMVQYDPGDSTSGLFGGNSNWRGPIWVPMNYLIINAIKKYGEFFGDDWKVECPKGSGNFLNLTEVANELARRILFIFQKDQNNNKAVFGNYEWFYQKPENQNLLLFHEYFHGDSGRGLGASHQTGWTALVVDIIRTNG
jgi:hypothetical protein